MREYLKHFNQTAQELTGACNNILNAEATISNSLQSMTLVAATKQQNRFIFEKIKKDMKSANVEIDWNITQAKQAISKIRIELDLIEDDLNDRLPKDARKIIEDFISEVPD